MLMTQLKELRIHPIDGFSAGLREDSNPFLWDAVLMGPSGTPYEGGMFKASLEFTQEYPNMPPTMKFQSTMWHPNVYSDGRVCISILHNPGDDAMGYESAAERWTPVHTVTTILLSVLSMLSTPNDESPANVEAAIQWRNDIKGYNRKLQQLARKSMEEI